MHELPITKGILSIALETSQNNGSLRTGALSFAGMDNRLVFPAISTFLVKQRLEELQRRFRKLLVVEGSATNELVLAKANILNAKHVVAALDAEVDNLLISITCKDMGGDVAVFARSNDVTIANRMRKAGVDEVISPSQICGDRVSSLILV